MTDRPIRRAEWLLVLAGCAAASLAAAAWSWRTGAMLDYGDAIAHLHIARRVFDSRHPGLSELGSVWLPFPHLLMVPFVAVFAWWANGLAGLIPSALAYLAGCAGIYRLARRWLSPATSALALAFFALNPNLLYMQTTAMTEPLFLCEMIWVSVWLVEWRQSLEQGETPPGLKALTFRPVFRGLNPPAPCVKSASSVGPASAGGPTSSVEPACSGESACSVTSVGDCRTRDAARSSRLLFAIAVALAAAVFTRYDGWIMALLAWVAVGVVLLRRGRLRSPAFWMASAIVVAAPVVWFAYNAIDFGDWLSFMRGPYSAAAIEARTATPGSGPPHPGWHNMGVALEFFVKAAEMDAAPESWGNQLLWLSALGTVWAYGTQRRHAFGWSLLLWLPLPFYAYSVAYGAVPIFLPVWWPHSYYNTRYGMELLPAFALGVAFAANFVLIVTREFEPRLTRYVTAGLFCFVAIDVYAVLRQDPLVYVEGTKNEQSRREYDTQIPPVLRTLRAAHPGAEVLTITSVHPELLAFAGIPLIQTINETDQALYQAALAAPAAHAGIVLALDGDEVDHAVKAHPQGLRVVLRVQPPHEPAATIYVSDTSSSRTSR